MRDDARITRLQNEMQQLKASSAIKPVFLDPINNGIGLIEEGTVTAAAILDGSITATKYAALSVTAAAIADLAVTSAKIADLEADKIVAGTGIVNNLTINATLTLGTGGKITDADGSEWNQSIFRLVSGGVVGDAFLLNSVGMSGPEDRFAISCDNSAVILAPVNLDPGLVAANPSLVFRDDRAELAWNGIGFNTFFSGVQVYQTGVIIGVGGVTMSDGGGSGIIYIPNALAAPSSNPTGGGILYTQSGALKYRGSSGTVTTIANA